MCASHRWRDADLAVRRTPRVVRQVPVRDRDTRVLGQLVSVEPGAILHVIAHDSDKDLRVVKGSVRVDGEWVLTPSAQLRLTAGRRYTLSVGTGGACLVVQPAALNHDRAVPVDNTMADRTADPRAPGTTT